MPFPFAIRVRIAGALASVGLLLSAGCGEGDRGTPAATRGDESAPSRDATGRATAPNANDATATQVVQLAGLLARAAEPGILPASERLALEQAMQHVVLPAASACDGCEVTVSYVDEAAGGDHFRCDLGTTEGEPAAEVQIFYRPGLPDAVARSWARSELAGHPASGLAGEALFVWPGRFEIRAFARADSLRGEQRLADLLQRLPLDALARL